MASTGDYGTLHALGSLVVDSCFESMATLAALNANENAW